MVLRAVPRTAVLIVLTATPFVGLAPVASAGPSDASGVLVTTTLGPANEVDLAINPTDPLNLVTTAKDYSLGENDLCDGIDGPVQFEVWAGIYASFDGGATWENRRFPGYPGSNQASKIAEYPCVSDPLVAFGPTGALYFVGIALEKPGTPYHGHALVFGISNDGGKTWPSNLMRLLYVGDDSSWADKPMMAVDAVSGTIYVTWDRITFSGWFPQISIGSADGASWTTKALGGPIHRFPTPAVGPDGTLYVSGIGTCANLDGDCVKMMTSDTFGASFTSEEVNMFDVNGGPSYGTSNDYRVVVLPTIAVSPNPARPGVAIAWHEYIPGLIERWQVIVEFNDGSGWALSYPDYTSAHHEVLPRVAFSPAGRLGVLYYEDPGTAAAPQAIRAMLAESADGTTWSAPLAMSPAFDTSTMLHQTGVVFVGDYVGLQYDRFGCANAAWADGRNGRSDVWYRRLDVPKCDPPQIPEFYAEEMCRFIDCEECPMCDRINPIARLINPVIRVVGPQLHRHEASLVQGYYQKACGIGQSIADGIGGVGGPGATSFDGRSAPIGSTEGIDGLPTPGREPLPDVPIGDAAERVAQAPLACGVRAGGLARAGT